MTNTIREKMQKGEKSLGTFVQSGSPNIAEVLGYTGLDYVIFDTEHAPYGEEHTMGMIRASKIPAFVRVKDHSRASIMRMLDIGAAGLVIPFVEHIDQIKEIIRYGKYPPAGERGFIYGRAAGYGHEDFCTPLPAYFKYMNRETMLIPQCETLGCLENIEEIAQMNGVDAIFVGPYDLSSAMGMAGEFDRGEFQAALKRIRKACTEAKKPCMIYAGSADQAKAYFEQGFSSCAIGIDIALLANAYKMMVRSVKE